MGLVGSRRRNSGRIVGYYRPILWVTPLKTAVAEKLYSSPVGIFCFRRKELRFRLRSWRSTPEGQSPDELRFCLSHFPSLHTSSKRIGRRAAPKSFCGDVPLVNAIRSSATDAAVSRRTMNTTIGSGSGAAAAPVAGRPSHFFRCFRSLTRTTVCWRAARLCGGALWSIVPGKRRRLRSKILIACLIPPRSVAGPTDWTALNRLFPFSVKRLPVSFTG